MPQKYEREIDDILRRMGGTLPNEPASVRARHWFERIRWHLPHRSPFLGVSRLSIKPSGLFFASIGLVLLSYVSQTLAPTFAAWLAVVALALFFGAIGLSVARSRRHPAVGWRGRARNYYSGDESVWTSLRRRWRSWLSRRRGPRF